MENIINIQSDCVRKTVLLEIPYSKIDINYYNIEYSMYIRISNKISYMHKYTDLYCVLINKKFIFSDTPIPLDSDILEDIENIRDDLVNYIKYYLRVQIGRRMNKTEYFIFQFRHNLMYLNSRDGNSNISDTNLFLSDTNINNTNIINTNAISSYKNTVDLINFYKKYMKNKIINIDNCGFDEYKGDRKSLLNDIINIQVDDRVYFYCTIVNILPPELIPYILSVRGRKKYLYYKMYKMYRGMYRRLSVMYVSRLVNIIEDRLIYYFRRLVYMEVIEKGWRDIFNIKREECIIENGNISNNIYNMEDASKEKVLSNTHIYPTNHIWEKNTSIENIGIHSKRLYFSESIMVEYPTNKILNTIIVESSKGIDTIRVYRRIPCEVLINNTFIHKDDIIFKEMRYEDGTEYINIEMVYIKRDYVLEYCIYYDSIYNIYKTGQIYCNMKSISCNGGISRGVFIDKGKEVVYNNKEVVYNNNDEYLEKRLI